MNLQMTVSLVMLCMLTIPYEGCSGHYKKKKLVIHVPVHIKEHKHTHTIVKHIHHHHKPIVKEETIIDHPIEVKEEKEDHEHFHHHYKHEDSLDGDFSSELKDPKHSFYSD